MSVTLEVSKLSGWLKTYALCRVEGRSMRCGGGAGREVGGRGAAAQAACTGRPDSRLLGARARAERTANMANMFVTLEVSRLSG